METSPLVSIIMPLYNAEKYVGEAIQSVIDQTYTNWELIIVNDGSTDNSLEVAQRYQSDKIKVFSQENKGQCTANNFGFALSRGDYIKFFDADDLLSANMLEEQVKRISDNNDCLASAQWGRFYNDDIRTFKLNPEECWQDMKPVDWICSSWRKAQPMMQCALWFIPRKILDKSGLWDERLSLINDFDFFTRVILASENIKFCSNTTLFYRSGMGGKALSGQKSRKAIESAFLSISLGVSTLLSVENNSLTRLCCANIWQGFIYEFYHQHPDLIIIAEKEILKLGGSDYKFPCGGITKIFVLILGWRIVTLMKKLIFQI